MSTRPRKQIGLFLALGALLLFGLVELAARLLSDLDSKWNVRLGAHRRYDPVTQFRNKSDYRLPGGVTTNEHGFLAPRGLGLAKPERGLRILYLGDSVTFHPPAENYPSQVERILEQRLDLDVETLNTAVPGFASHNALNLFETEVSRYDADYLVVYLGWNDLGQYGPDGLPYKRIDQGYEVSPLQRLASRLYSIRLLYQLRRMARQRRPAVDEALDADELARYGGYDPHHFRDNLRRIVRLGGQRYDHVIVMTLATLTSDEPAPDELQRLHFPVGMEKNARKLHLLVQAYNHVVRDVAAQEAAALIDLYVVFEDPSARDELRDSCHVNAAGARRIAEAVAQAVTETRP